MNSEKLIGALGLAFRARGMVVGQQAVEDCMMRGRARVLLLDPSMSSRNRRQWETTAVNWNVPMLILPESGMLERATGKDNARTACVVDSNFEKLIRKSADSE